MRGEGIHLTVYVRVNTTREELRYASTYRPGQTLEVGRGGAQDVGIRAGRYDVLKVHANGKVELADGRRKLRFDPQKLSPTEQRDRLQLSEKKDLHLISTSVGGVLVTPFLPHGKKVNPLIRRQLEQNKI